ncbi:MAG TPA: 2Fe-2S iron-sulfur cluster-binding protein [Pelobium sp.]
MIKFQLIYEGVSYQVITRHNDYANLMMLISDRFADEDFGDCRGMGKCGSCTVEIANTKVALSDFGRNETTTLKKMDISAQNVRLSCQLIIDDKLNDAIIKVC